jgi:two-component system sensor histidine kinase/response regulator
LDTTHSMTGHYDPSFVALSIVIAVLSAYAALDLAGRVTSSRRRKTRFAWVAGGAVAMGIGIWSMHYIGMLAMRMDTAVLYDWPTVLLSLAAAILASAVALFTVSRKTMGVVFTALGSLCMGIGIASMHYIGMAAMRMPALRLYNTPLVVLSVALAILISFAALRLTYASRHVTKSWTWRKTLSALLMGFAIPVMHYTGMAAARFIPAPLDSTTLRHAVSISDLGAMSIALVTIVMLCLVFLSAMVDRHLSHQTTQLEGSEERYRKIIGSTFDAFLGFGADGLITDWNVQAERTFGWSDLEATGMSLCDLIKLHACVDSTAEENVESLRLLLSSSTDSPLQDRMEVVARHKTGVTFPAEMAISAITMGDSRIFAAFVHDVTERKAAERQMEESREAAEAASRAKSEFLANMSHEIRTPLNGVIGMTDLALETELTTEQREYMETVKLSADSLLNVINDILDFSKIEAGKVDIEVIRYDLRECLESTLKTLALRADEKGLELLCDINPAIPDALLGDPGRVRQITTNLIGNAIKFTAQGEVSLHVVAEQVEGAGSVLHFTVSDTGIGIAPEKLEKIFESFSQADTSTTREYGGTGLGLTISKRLIELIGGRIWIQSELGQGSHFHFTLPLLVAEELEKATDTDKVYHVLVGMKVLVIDDNKTNRRILEGLLKAWGMVPTVVADGVSALSHMATAQESGQPYKLILTDMHMPQMDGFGVIERIQQNPGLSPATILMLSSGGHRGDAAKCQSLGIAAYLLKPVRQTELREAITRAIGMVPLPGNTSMITQKKLREQRSESEFLSILLAEDNPVNQKLAVRLLEKRGHSMAVVDNGREAVDMLARRTFDLVLMDIQMPEMDGITATNIIRERERSSGHHQPIVAMTALVMKGDRERCLAAEMDGYLSKPIRPGDLDEVLERYTSRKQREREAVQAPVNPPVETVNFKELMERVDGDLDFVSELSDVFREDYPRQIDTANSCLHSGDAQGLKRAAHGLKGALANLAAHHACGLAASLERSAGLGELDVSGDLLRELEGELPRVFAALQEGSREYAL